MKIQDYDKLKTALRYWLLGKEYHLTLKALEFGLAHHTGVRKDGVMPEFQHQVSQASFARTLSIYFTFPDETLATILLHDTVEDTDVSIEEITAEFGERIACSVELMTNCMFDTQGNAIDKPLNSYYHAMRGDPIASIAKGCDRMHNHQTMVGVW